ncbi:hypothetical protein [Leptospira sp. GIMC2001]|uniref:hypothetical protein n=1 Tax=Leptospira sp. GIMC2001 TaxID=1513297 RepID=UPI00234B3849|nr:hypothetical protein [Leptospira sp. GIMC2001]WCL49228.1 hypothetical protein O4O04_18330 [Leptospira sp. GIMC2001]
MRNSSDYSSSLSGTYSSQRFTDFNTRFFKEGSSAQTYIDVRIIEEDSKIYKTELVIVEYQDDFVSDQNNFFQNQPKPFSIKINKISGKVKGSPGPTGFTVQYETLQSKFGYGNSLEEAYENYKKSSYKRDSIDRREKWETIKDGLWLAEETEKYEAGEFAWKHLLGTLDFFHPRSEFKSSETASASLDYDYNLNRFKKLKIDKIADAANLVFEGKESSIYYLNGKITLQKK